MPPTRRALGTHSRRATGAALAAAVVLTAVGSGCSGPAAASGRNVVAAVSAAPAAAQWIDFVTGPDGRAALDSFGFGDS